MEWVWKAEVTDGVLSPPPYPEGGRAAWLTVSGAFLALFCTFGQLNAIGTFQTWYGEHQLRDLPPSTIAWIGSLQLWMFFFSVSSADFGGHRGLFADRERTMQGRFHWTPL